MKFSRAALASLVFLVLLGAVYYVHIRFFRVNVVFYAAIADGVLAAVLASILLYVLPYFAIFNRFEKFSLAVIWVMAGYIFAISVPTVIDRSLSLYLLEKLQQRGGGIRQDRIDMVFTEEYLREHRLMDVRLTEQQESGTIVIEHGCVKLTGKGDTIATASRKFRQTLLPRKRLLMGEYSDDLTDPFRHSRPAPDYACD